MSGDRTRPATVGFAELVERAEGLASRSTRQLLGIVGPPGAGKSRLAAALAGALGPRRAVVIGMDGFHLADAVLGRTGLRERKGAPDTFDQAGYLAMLRRLRTERATVYAPAFDRTMEDSIAAAIAVPAELPLVITEGNYLLLWPQVRPLLDELWYLDPDPDARLRALVERHVAHGKSPEQASRWARESDQRNAELIEADRDRADLILPWGDW